jgi:TFIIF-interacting CTD phosphatase-like protein
MIEKNRLYILDLDHCLIYASFQELAGAELKSKRKWHYLYHRPGLEAFLSFVQKTGDVMFYTSSKKDYASWVVSTFELTVPYTIYSRKYCRKKYTDYGEIYFKSLSRLPISKKYTNIIVLDDRTDLWDEYGVQLNDIKPYHGELADKELHRWKISQIKKQPKLTSLEEILSIRKGNSN